MVSNKEITIVFEFFEVSMKNKNCVNKSSDTIVYPEQIFPKAYLGYCQTSVIERFCENCLESLKAVNYFRKKAPSSIFYRVLNVLHFIEKQISFCLNLFEICSFFNIFQCCFCRMLETSEIMTLYGTNGLVDFYQVFENRIYLSLWWFFGRKKMTFSPFLNSYILRMAYMYLYKLNAFGLLNKHFNQKDVYLGSGEWFLMYFV